MGTTIGEQFVTALAAKDRSALEAILDPDLELRALTPKRHWEADTAKGFVDEILLGMWFDDGDDITEVLSTESEEIGTRNRVSYRLAVTNSDGPHVVAQEAFYDVTDGRISWLRILCAGYQPVSPATD